MLSEQRKEQAVEFVQSLIRIPSYSGEEGEVVECIKENLSKLGYDECFVDEYGNVIGRLKGNRPGKSILYDAHIDTVPVIDPSVWTQDPFGGEIVDGKLYGRGTTDMKGSFAAMAIAAAFFSQDVNRDFAGDIYVAGVVHEECFEGVAARKISEKVKPDYVVIGEASELNLKIGQRGRAEIVVETFGVPAHSANPHKGVNAVYQMSKVIDRIRNLEMTYQEGLGHGILELTDIKSSPYPGASVVPDHCRVTYDRRLLVGETKEGVLKPIQDLLDQMQEEDPTLKAKVSYAVGKEKCYTGNMIEGERFFPGWLYDEEDEFVQKAYKALKIAGLDPEITQYSFCTNGSHYAGEAGIKTIGFGPSTETLAHTIDEHIELDSLYKAMQGYYFINKIVLA